MPTTLLLADDSSTIQRVVALTFAQDDVRVISVADGEQALQSLATERPDIILADAGMPKLDGYALSSRLKASPELKHIPILLLAGAFEPVDQKRLKDAKCDGVLVKPFEPRILVTRVQELLDSARAQRVADSTPRLTVPPTDGRPAQETATPDHNVPSWYKDRAGTTTRHDAPVLDAADLDQRLGQLVKDSYTPVSAAKPAAPPAEPARPVAVAPSPATKDPQERKAPPPQAPSLTVAPAPVRTAAPPAPPAPPASPVARAAAPVEPLELNRTLDQLAQKLPAAAPVTPAATPSTTLLLQDAPVAPAPETAPEPIVRPETRPAVTAAPSPPAPPAPARPAEAQPVEVPTPAPAPAPPVSLERTVSLAAAFTAILEAEQAVLATGISTPKSDAVVDEALRRALFGHAEARESSGTGGPATQ